MSSLPEQNEQLERARLLMLCITAAASGMPAMADLVAEHEELVRARTELVQLRQAMASREVIGEAKGVLMGIGEYSPETAWKVLVTTSQRANVKLRTVAAYLVETPTGGPLPEPVRTALQDAIRLHTSENGEHGP